MTESRINNQYQAADAASRPTTTPNPATVRVFFMENDMAEVTDWFTHQIEPARKGVYQRIDSCGNVTYSLWNGRFWCMNSDNFQRAKEITLGTGFPELKWRGLAQDPALKGGEA